MYTKEKPMKLYTAYEADVNPIPHLNEKGIWVVVYYDPTANSSSFGWR